MKATYTIGVWGCGVVGGSTARLFEEDFSKEVSVLKYDRYKEGKWTTPKKLVESSDFIFLCLPTPMQIDGKIDLSYIEKALKEISEFVPKRSSDKIIIIRSTVIPGTGDYFAKVFPKMNIVIMPEFLTESNPWEDIVNTTRVVIGTPDKKIFIAIRNLFGLIYGDKVDFILMQRAEAEMYKYACNYLLAMSVLAANELYFICEALNIDYSLIQENFRYDSRISSHTRVPGPDGDFGIGGKCFPKDVNALYKAAQGKGYDPAFIRAGLELNDRIRKNKDWLTMKGVSPSCSFDD